MIWTGQTWLGIGICACLIFVGYAVGAMHQWGRGYDAAERDLTGPARHRKSDVPRQLAVAGLLDLDPPTEVIDRHTDPATVVFGEPDMVGPAEYELLTRVQAFEDLADEPDRMTDSAFTRGQVAQVEAMIQGWEAQGNYDRHTIQARQ